MLKSLSFSILLLCGSLPNSSTAFTEVPSSQVVFVGEEAVFRCRHPTANFFDWRVNGSSVGQNPPPDIIPGTIRDDDGSLVNTLTIIACPEYNGTEVVCVAVFLDGSPTELSPPVLLQVSSPAPPGFTVTPTDLTVAQGVGAIFHCQHPTAIAISWTLNETSLLQDLSIRDVTVHSIAGSGGIFNTLIIVAHPQINQTRVKCVAVHFDGLLIIMDSNIVNLTIQGEVAAVSDLSRSSTTITWDEPFSLNLTDINPDIAYCVEVYNITCGRRDLIISDCNVTEPSYTSNTLYEGFLYNITVTARSNINVPDALNGISSTITEQFVLLNVLQERNFISQDRKLSVNLHFMKDSLDKVQPFSYSLLIHFVDGVNDSELMSPFPVSVVSKQTHDQVVLSASLPWRRILVLQVLPNECSDVISDDIELSTHDIQNISVSSPLPGQVRVTGDLIEGSTATGVFIVVYSQSDDSDVHYNSSETEGKSVEIILGGLTGSQYGVSVFVLEDGLPFSRAATSPQLLHINPLTQQGSTPQEATLIEYEIHANSTGVCITCTFLSSSTADCVAVVHQRISQLSSSGLMNIESSHKFSRSGDTAYGCIEAVNLTNYQVRVFRGSEFQGFLMPSSETGLLISSGLCQLWCITGIVLGIVVSTSFILIISLICLYIANNRASHTNSTPEETVDMKRCAAYEVTTLAKQKVVMVTNPAYEQVTVN